MNTITYRLTALFLIICSFSANAQQSTLVNFTPDPGKVQMYSPYLATRHGGPEGLETLKNTDRFQYYKELWYFTESFSVVRDHLSEGVVLNEEIIDISRFEYNRKYDEEVIVTLPGFKDALKLLPGKNLLYKPEYVK